MRYSLTQRLMTCAAAAFLMALGPASLLADDALRHVQQSLRDQGFYYGSIDGQPGDETTQAIRRYQIRNGLAVSGQLDDATRKSIDRNESNVAKGTKSDQGTIASSGSDDRAYAQGDATPPPLNPSAPPADNAPVFRSLPHPPPDTSNDGDQQQQSAPASAPGRADQRIAPPGAVVPSPELTAMFQRTPYEFAPPPVQADVLRHAQAALLRDGFYDGVANGIPGPRTSEALSNLQQVSHIRATGRLDVQTLAILRLLPARQVVPRHVYGPQPGPGGVYEGRIVQ